ncbi:hypothetical protein O9993_06860 [Vibrio lentus]|nr:hypothetical protein [Vibrio lentus]
MGYWIGAIKFGHFSLGAVTGTLIAGVLIGQLDISISSQVKINFLHALFCLLSAMAFELQFVQCCKKWCSTSYLCRGYFTSVLCCNLCWLRKWPVTT